MAGGARGPAIQRATRTAKRLWPLALEGYRRWQNLPPDQRERYMRQARDAAGRARRVVDQKRAQRGGRHGRFPGRRHH
ncbi:MAG: hypothetical protein H0V29_03445 [Thermoleophilaceae bacterium]|nr:hypothetical protein [Thermoleophilaceae bacterium]